MPKKLTYEFVKNSFEKEGYTLVSEEYKNARQRLKYKCPKGHTHNMTWKNWYQGNRCVVCSNNKKRLSIEEIKSSFEKENYALLSDEYKNSFYKLKYKCPLGHINTIRWSDWQQGYRCKSCNIESRRQDILFIKSEMMKEGYVLLDNKYISNKTKMKCKCKNNHVYNTTWSLWKQGCRCPECNKINIELVMESFLLEGYVLLSRKYINAHSKLDYICPCGHNHSVSWANWHSGCRCPTCAIIKMTGSGSSSWRGGKSYEPYCEVWRDQEYKKDIKQRDSNRCLNPACVSKNPNDLTIHHIDYNKKNCKPSNLITVCRSCNSKANTDRKWYKSWYGAIIKNRYHYRR